jgi:CCR4-NOT transcription complex subunit 10
MGLIHYAVRHYALAVRFFQQALKYDAIATKDVSEMGHPLYAVGATRRSDILYNLGIGLLYLQRPKEAFECLLITLNKHHNNARLWLRLAEACIMVHNQNLKDKENKNIVASVIGSGVHRKHVIQPSPHKYVS